MTARGHLELILIVRRGGHEGQLALVGEHLGLNIKLLTLCFLLISEEQLPFVLVSLLGESGFLFGEFGLDILSFGGKRAQKGLELSDFGLAKPAFVCYRKRRVI